MNNKYKRGGQKRPGGKSCLEEGKDTPSPCLGPPPYEVNPTIKNEDHSGYTKPNQRSAQKPKNERERNDRVVIESSSRGGRKNYNSF